MWTVLSIVPQRQTYLQRLSSIFVCACVLWYVSSLLLLVDFEELQKAVTSFPVEFHWTLPWLFDFLKGPYTEA